MAIIQANDGKQYDSREIQNIAGSIIDETQNIAKLIAKDVLRDEERWTEVFFTAGRIWNLVKSKRAYIDSVK